MSVWHDLFGQPRAQQVLRAAALESRILVDGNNAVDSPSTNSAIASELATAVGEPISSVPAINTDTAAQFSSSSTALHSQAINTPIPISGSTPTTLTINRGALAQSWLITGPPGSGRSVAGKVLAAALQCVGKTPGCGECDGCAMVEAGTHPDVRLVATDKLVLSIDETRELIPWAQTMPSLGRWRVVIIEDADRMAERTTNVLLKSIEEPPERTIWVLCAPTAQEMLPTIRSRCRLLHLRTPTVQAVAEHLVETTGADPLDAEKAAVLSQCHVGIARALLENPHLRAARRQLFSSLLLPKTVGEAVLAAGNLVNQAKLSAKEEAEQRNTTEMANLRRSLGLQPGERVPTALRSQVKALEEDQARRARRSLTDVLDRVMLDLLSFYRDVLICQLDAKTQFVNVDMVDEIKDVAANSLKKHTLARVHSIEAARKRLSSFGNPQIVVDALAVSLLYPAALSADSTDGGM